MNSTDIVTIIFLIGILLILVSFLFKKKNSISIDKYNICARCGDDKKIKGTRGNVYIGIFLFIISLVSWLLLLVAIIYAIWCSEKKYVCLTCGSCDFIPKSSMRGKLLLKKL